MKNKLKLFLKERFCKNGFHIWQDKMNFEESWHECWICKWQVSFSEEEYKALGTLYKHTH